MIRTASSGLPLVRTPIKAFQSPPAFEHAILFAGRSNDQFVRFGSTNFTPATDAELLARLADLMFRSPDYADPDIVPDPNITRVSMGEGKVMKVRPGEKKTLFTYGLCGCQAVFLLSQHPNGESTTLLTHYPPTDLFKNIRKLKQLIRENPEIQAPGTRYQFMIAIPNEDTWDPSMTLAQKMIDILTQSVENELNTRMPAKILPYKMWSIREEKSRAFIIDINPDGTVSYAAPCNSTQHNQGAIAAYRAL